MIQRIGKTFFLVRRVPKAYAEVESRKRVKVSLKTDSESKALAKAPQVWDHLVEGWEAKMEGDYKLAEFQFLEARRHAQRLGLRYTPAREIAKMPADEIMRRVEIAHSGGADAENAALGLVEMPELKVSQALDLFWELSADKTTGKTEDQMRRWRNPRVKSFRLFQEAVGDVAVTRMTRDDMLVFRDYLVERVNRGEITAASANKDIIHFVGPIRHINKMKGLGLDLPFSDLALQVGRAARRGVFSPDWIRNVILAPGALDGMGIEARLIIRIMVNTGARPSEIAGAMVHHCKLDETIPMLDIVPEGRRLKNDHSERRLPLAGVSLEAAREAVEIAQRDGRDKLFPTYFGRDRFSDAANKFFRENGLKEAPNTTVYSLRHSFEDRMIEAGVLDRVRRDLFGHQLQEQRYGTGGGDQVRYEAVQSVAI